MLDQLKFRQMALAALVSAVVCGAPSVAAAIQYQYDTNGRLIKVIYDNGVTITYVYDAAGNRVQLVPPTPPPSKSVWGSFNWGAANW